MRKADTRTVALRDRILDAAEALYAEHGLHGVSLRQISAAAGARNTNAVQYHFGNAEGLARALLERHTTVLELERATLLARFAGRGKPGCRELIEVIFRPILGESASGEVSALARFSLALLASPKGWQPMTEVFLAQPVTRQVLDLVVEANRPVPGPITLHRLLYSGIAFLTYAVNAAQVVSTAEGYEAAVNDALTLAAVGLSAPVADGAAQLADELEQYFTDASEH